MTEKPIAAEILDEARGAHGASRRILKMMQSGADPDPILDILTLLRSLKSGQRSILTRLEIIERRLASLG